MARTLRCGGGYAGEKLKPVCRAYILGIDRSLLSYNRSLLPYMIGLFCHINVYIVGIVRDIFIMYVRVRYFHNVLWKKNYEVEKKCHRHHQSQRIVEVAQTETCTQ